jgi:twitching motility protein PilT
LTTLEEFLAEARQRGASDLHLSAGAVPYVRVEGEITRLPREELGTEEADALAAACAKRGGVEPGNDVDFCFEEKDRGRFRVNLHRHARGSALSIKCIPLAVQPLAALGLPESLNEATWFRTGMVLATGPAGCGKTCTLAALLQEVNRSRKEHIVTIEDPIEFVFPSEGCNVTQRQVGPHTRSFSRALRAALREDPNVILVSELRDVETIRTAVVAAETGHLVLGTLHTRDAASTVSRLIDVFPPSEQDQIRTMIAASLRTVISQRLLPRAGGGRRVPAYEILQVTPAVAHVIREGAAHKIPSQLQTGRRQGMIDLDARLAEMLAQGLIDRATAARHAKNRKRFEDGE